MAVLVESDSGTRPCQTWRARSGHSDMLPSHDCLRTIRSSVTGSTLAYLLTAVVDAICIAQPYRLGICHMHMVCVHAGSFHDRQVRAVAVRVVLVGLG